MKWQAMAKTNIYSVIYKLIETLESPQNNIIRVAIFVFTTILLIIAIYMYFSTLMEYKSIERSGFEDESKMQFLKEKGKRQLRRMQVMIVIWLLFNAIFKLI